MTGRHRLADKPWKYLNRVIKMYANPKYIRYMETCQSTVLRVYGTIAFAEWETYFNRSTNTYSQIENGTRDIIMSTAMGIQLGQSGQMLPSIGLQNRAILCLTRCILGM